MADNRTRLYLIAPPLTEAESFLDKLLDAVSAGDVACLLVPLAARDEGSAKKIVRALLEVTEPRGIALLIDNVGLVQRAGADGAHLRISGETLEKTLTDAVERLKPDRIIGAGGLRAKHDAMVAGEYDVDYVSFGDPAPDGYVPAIEQIVERVAWWADIFNIPCVGYAATLADVGTLAQAGADFVSLREAVWDDARGPSAAVSEAMVNLTATGASAKA